jgi:hypothetical protein
VGADPVNDLEEGAAPEDIDMFSLDDGPLVDRADPLGAELSAEPVVVGCQDDPLDSEPGRRQRRGAARLIATDDEEIGLDFPRRVKRGEAGARERGREGRFSRLPDGRGCFPR